jgi:hypothetical protein
MIKVSIIFISSEPVSSFYALFQKIENLFCCSFSYVKLFMVVGFSVFYI